MVENENGEVAIRYRRQQQKNVQVGDALYLFRIRAGSISLAWVRPEHVDSVLNMKAGCCGRKQAGVFKYATETDVRRWNNNGGR